MEKQCIISNYSYKKCFKTENELVWISAARKKAPKPSIPSLRLDLVPLGFVVFLFQAMATQNMDEMPTSKSRRGVLSHVTMACCLCPLTPAFLVALERLVHLII